MNNAKELLAQVSTGRHITYQEQYRKCGKRVCSTCQKGLGHGPYWYAYWRGEDGKLHSNYIGKIKPEGETGHMKDEDLERARQITQTQMATLGNSLFQKETLMKQNGKTLPIAKPVTRRLRLEDIELYTVGEDISLESLFQSRHSYKFPDFQRDFVWTMRDEQLLIDSALRPQFDIDSIEVFEEMSSDGPIRYIIDGGQRFRALIWFRENRFPTFSPEQFRRASRNNGFSIIEPKRLFAEMTVMGQNKYKARNIHLRVTRVHGNYTFEEVQSLIAERFRRAQHHRRLNVAEILYSYPSEAKEFAKEIANHTTWTEIYQQTKRTKRRQPYAIGLIVIALHLKPSPVNLTTNELENIACGLYDTYLTPDLLESINLFLNRLHHIFYGVRATSTSDVIPLIQACQLLEQEGYDLEQSERACLTDWFFKARPAANTAQAWGKFSQMGQLTVQRQFWTIQRDKLFEQSGLAKSNKGIYPLLSV